MAELQQLYVLELKILLLLAQLRLPEVEEQRDGQERQERRVLRDCARARTQTDGGAKLQHRGGRGQRRVANVQLLTASMNQIIPPAASWAGCSWLQPACAHLPVARVALAGLHLAARLQHRQVAQVAKAGVDERSA